MDEPIAPPQVDNPVTPPDEHPKMTLARIEAYIHHIPGELQEEFSKLVAKLRAAL